RAKKLDTAFQRSCTDCQVSARDESIQASRPSQSMSRLRLPCLKNQSCKARVPRLSFVRRVGMTGAVGTLTTLRRNRPCYGAVGRSESPSRCNRVLNLPSTGRTGRAERCQPLCAFSATRRRLFHRGHRGGRGGGRAGRVRLRMGGRAVRRPLQISPRAGRRRLRAGREPAATPATSFDGLFAKGRAPRSLARGAARRPPGKKGGTIGAASSWRLSTACPEPELRRGSGCRRQVENAGGFLDSGAPAQQVGCRVEIVGDDVGHDAV